MRAHTFRGPAKENPFLDPGDAKPRHLRTRSTAQSFLDLNNRRALRGLPPVTPASWIALGFAGGNLYRRIGGRL